jgi:hypothetical protein
MAGIEANVSIRTNDSAPINNEKVRAKLEKKLLDSMKTMKDDEKIPFLMTRLIELEQKNLEIKREVEEQKRENGKTTMVTIIVVVL